MLTKQMNMERNINSQKKFNAIEFEMLVLKSRKKEMRSLALVFFTFFSCGCCYRSRKHVHRTQFEMRDIIRFYANEINYN